MQKRQAPKASRMTVANPIGLLEEFRATRVQTKELGTRVIKESALEPVQCLILSVLGAMHALGHKSLSQTELVDYTATDRSSLSKSIRLLHDRGLVLRPRNEDDLRARAVALTDEGHKLLKQVARKVGSIDIDAILRAKKAADEAKKAALLEKMRKRS